MTLAVPMEQGSEKLALQGSGLQQVLGRSGLTTEASMSIFHCLRGGLMSWLLSAPQIHKGSLMYEPL